MSPFITMYFLANVAEKIKFDKDFVEFAMSPKSLSLVKTPQEELLKPIQSFFTLNETKDPSAFQIILDENFVNYAFTQFISQEKKWSIREAMSKQPRLAIMRQLLTTTTIGSMIPSFKEQYGEDKQVDILATLHHHYVAEALENLVPTGFSLDKKGNFKL